MLAALPSIIAAASKPMENIDRISILDARGLHGDGGPSQGAANGGGNLADAAVAAALRYRVGGPLIDSLMSELGMDGSSMNGLIAGTHAQAPSAKSEKSAILPPPSAPGKPNGKASDALPAAE